MDRHRERVADYTENSVYVEMPCSAQDRRGRVRNRRLTAINGVVSTHVHHRFGEKSPFALKVQVNDCYVGNLRWGQYPATAGHIDPKTGSPPLNRVPKNLARALAPIP